MWHHSVEECTSNRELVASYTAGGRVSMQMSSFSISLSFSFQTASLLWQLICTALQVVINFQLAFEQREDSLHWQSHCTGARRKVLSLAQAVCEWGIEASRLFASPDTVNYCVYPVCPSSVCTVHPALSKAKEKMMEKGRVPVTLLKVRCPVAEATLSGPIIWHYFGRSSSFHWWTLTSNSRVPFAGKLISTQVPSLLPKQLSTYLLPSLALACHVRSPSGLLALSLCHRSLLSASVTASAAAAVATSLGATRVMLQLIGVIYSAIYSGQISQQTTTPER